MFASAREWIRKPKSPSEKLGMAQGASGRGFEYGWVRLRGFFFHHQDQGQVFLGTGLGEGTNL